MIISKFMKFHHKALLSSIKSLLFYTKKAGLDSPTFKHVIKNYFNVTEAPTSSN
jgi:hypothetical protein